MARQARKPQEPKEEFKAEATTGVTRATHTREKEPKFIGQLVKAIGRGERYFGYRGSFLYQDELDELNTGKRRLRGLQLQAEETLKSMNRKLEKED